jgi:CheY-like chemotaxis protein
MRRFLTNEGYRALIAASGGEGIELARAHRPSVILLDLAMPGKDGWDVLKDLRADPELIDIPVVLLALSKDTSRGFTLGPTELLPRPIERHLGRVLGKYRCEGPLCPALIIDDDPAMRAMFRGLLERDGWLVREAENGLIGLTLLSEARPDLIILDLLMPVMDGLEFFQELRSQAEWRGIPVVVVTAHDLSEQDHRRLDASVQRTLQSGAPRRRELLAEIRAVVSDHVREGAAVRTA